VSDGDGGDGEVSDGDGGDGEVSDGDGDGPDAYNLLQLAKHNEYRRLHVDTPDLVYDAELAAHAFAWSTYLAEQNEGLEHSNEDSDPPRNRFEEGENLAWSSNSRDGDWSSIAWYAEIEDYDWSNPGSSGHNGVIGHFT